MHALDRGAAQAGDRAGGFDRELANLVLLIEAGLDLFDHIVEVLHRRADGPSRYLRAGPQATGANLTTARPTPAAHARHAQQANPSRAHLPPSLGPTLLYAYLPTPNHHTPPLPPLPTH